MPLLNSPRNYQRCSPQWKDAVCNLCCSGTRTGSMFSIYHFRTVLVRKARAISVRVSNNNCLEKTRDIFVLPLSRIFAEGSVHFAVSPVGFSIFFYEGEKAKGV